MKSLKPVITKCVIGKYPRPLPDGMLDKMPEVKVTLSTGEEKTLFEFYPDEISFTSFRIIKGYRPKEEKSNCLSPPFLNMNVESEANNASR